MIFSPLESWDSRDFNGAKIIKNGYHHEKLWTILAGTDNSEFGSNNIYLFYRNSELAQKNIIYCIGIPNMFFVYFALRIQKTNEALGTTLAAAGGIKIIFQTTIVMHRWQKWFTTLRGDLRFRRSLHNYLETWDSQLSKDAKVAKNRDRHETLYAFLGGNGAKCRLSWWIALWLRQQ